MKKPPQARKAVATQPASRKFPFIGASWVLVGFSSMAIALCVAASATDILRGHVRVEERASAGKQAVPRSSGMESLLPKSERASSKADDLAEDYGPAANSPSVAAAIARAKSVTPDLKAAADRQEALSHGIWKPGADPTQAIMYGYVPPGMPPQQAAMLYSTMPHLPKMQQPMPPEITDPDPVRDMLRAQGLEQFNNQSANQQMAESHMRERFGPVYVPPLHMDHNWLAQHARRTNTGFVADHQMSLIAPEYGFDTGSVREMTDSSGNIVYQQSFDPYGNAVKLQGSGPVPDFGFDGYYVHQRSGLNLTLTRPYSPVLGRFLNRDPIGESGGVNLYAYVDNNPISNVDPLGLKGVWGPGQWKNDALRHCTWACELSKILGPGAVLQLGLDFEIWEYSHGESAGSALMDLNNNDVGIQGPRCQNCSDYCHQKLREGALSGPFGRALIPLPGW